MATRDFGAVNMQFAGSWTDRVFGLGVIGVDFKGKRVLDVGCNMGIVGYEVCKQEPRYYHGIEVLPWHKMVAEAIFGAVTVPHDIVEADICEQHHVLDQSYDVALLLAVTQHMRKVSGDTKTENAVNAILSRVGEVVYRGTDQDWFISHAQHHGFKPVELVCSDTLRPLIHFTK